MGDEAGGVLLLSGEAKETKRRVSVLKSNLGENNPRISYYRWPGLEGQKKGRRCGSRGYHICVTGPDVQEIKRSGGGVKTESLRGGSGPINHC